MKINYRVNLIIVCVSILAIITISGCGYKNADTKDYPATGNTTGSASAFTKDYSTSGNTTGSASAFTKEYSTNGNTTGSASAFTKDYSTNGSTTSSTSAYTKDYSTNSNTTGFADQFDYNYNSNEGVYHVKGSITNEGSKTAHNISVMLSFTDRNGSVLHQKRIQIGDINPSEEKSVSYDWAGPKEATLDTKVYQDIKQVLPDNNYNINIEDREINWGDEE